LAIAPIFTTTDPTLGIKNSVRQRKLPDRLTLAERDAVIAATRERYPGPIASAIEFAFLTGLRTEEMLALEWGDVDLDLKLVHIARAKTFRGRVKDTKTHSARDVPLVPRAIELLLELKPRATGPVFVNPRTSVAWHDERRLREIWHATLKVLGIRRRRPYCTRHTWATACLMAGLQPALIARWMGHTTPEQLYNSYARWIDRADGAVQRGRLADALFPGVSPASGKTSIPGAKNGRRDWTRTNDPHHVKVVL